MEKNWMPVLLETLNAPTPTKEPVPEPGHESAPKGETVAEPVPGGPVASAPEGHAAPARPVAQVPCSDGFGFAQRSDSLSGAIDDPFAAPRRPMLGYAGETPWDESLSERIAAHLPGIAIALLLLGALGLLSFFYRAQVGQTLVRLGEKMSGQPALQTAVGAPAPAVNPSPVQPAPQPPQSAPDQRPIASSNASAATADAAANPPADPLPQPAAKNPASAPSDSSPAADNGLTEFRLARESRNQARTPQEKARTASLLWDAVSKGSSDAEVELADIYGRGDGVLKNCQQARILLAAARDKDNPLAEKESSELESYGCR